MSRNVIHTLQEYSHIMRRPEQVPPSAWSYHVWSWKNSSLPTPKTLLTYDADYPAVVQQVTLHTTYAEPHAMVLAAQDGSASWYLTGGAPTLEASQPAPTNIVIDMWDKPYAVESDLEFWMAEQVTGSSGIILANALIWEWEA
jgi:hypothetical protein